MEMIPSVQERKKNVNSFMNSYPYLCRLQNTIPNPNIKVNSSNNFLDFVGDRIKHDDWKPLLEAIANDRCLHFISIRSRHRENRVLKEADRENEARQISTPHSSSSALTNSTVLKISEALSKCMSNSQALTGLLLERLLLSSDALNQLTQGLEVCRNLQQLSLLYSQIGDDGCASLCHVLRRRLNLVWLNLTGCGLTDKGVGTLCNLLKFQKLNRYGESWKQSLRCRPVNPNTMPGLRRLTLNHNPIGDAGVRIFVETLVDDLWLKALDLQNCNVSLEGGEALLSLVKDNQFLSVVDVRGNVQLPQSLVGSIVQQLAENNSDTTPEFQWLKEDNPKSGRGSSSGTSVNRSSRRMLSNTTIASKGLSVLSVLPNKARITRPQAALVHCARTRSASAKRTQITSNSPRPPWNWNFSNPSLRRGNSDHLISDNKKISQDIQLELNSVKEHLQEVSRRLEEETERRIKIEQELEKYKQLIELPNSSISVDKSTLQNIFYQFYNAYLMKDSSAELPKNKVEEAENEPKMQNHDSLEYLIRTVNGDNSTRPDINSAAECKSPTSSPRNGYTSIPSTPTKAQLLFESLISS